ncbi:MAG: putative T7SS-secreted protein [Streptosporangiaceae bacterium]
MSWWSSVRHVAADVLTAPSRGVASALRDVGATGLANDIDGFDSRVSSFIGGAQAELQLGQTGDPTQLIHGDAQQVGDAATRLKAFSAAFGEVSTGLAGVNVEHWQGVAADAFRAKYAPEPKRWSDAGTACGESSAALADYAHTLTWAQDQARDAITLYARGQQATAHAQAAYSSAVSGYNTKAAAYNAALQAGKNPGTRPVQPGPFVDPGAADRAEAQSMLSAARARRDAAADHAPTTLARATDLAPATPSFLSQLRDDLSDGWNVGNLGATHFAGGFLSGASGFLDFLRSANPMDPYNVLHPGEYLTGLDALQAELVDMSLHPSVLIDSVLGTGWRSDPFNAGGNLSFNLLLLEEGGDDPDSTSLLQRVFSRDPVDVATGEVLLSQTDLALPGLLPLMVERTHISSYRIGQWFGPSWASSLDQRLEVTPQGVTFIAADGMKLHYPHPHPDTVGGIAWPRAGSRWPLRRTESGGYLIADPASGQVLVFEIHATWGIWPISWIGNRAGQRLLFIYTDDGRPSGMLHSGGYRIRIDTSDEGRIRGLYLVGAADDGGEVELVRYEYSGGHLTEVFNSSGLPLRFTYDDAGRMTSWRDRNDVTYRYGYDVDGRVEWAAGPDGFMSGTFAYDTERRITTVTNAAGNVSRYAANECGRVISETDPLGNTTLSQWDRHGRLTRRTDPLGATTGYEYDVLGNLQAVHYPDGSSSTIEHDQWSQPVTVTGPDGALWRYAYDPRGNRISENDPAGGVTRYEHDERGGLTAVIDPLGAVTQVECDEAGLPAVVTDPAGGVTRLERDAFGRVVVVTDPVGSVTRLGWTIEGKLAWRTSATGGTELWTYDGEGNLTEYTDADGRVTRTEYSHLDLPAARTGPDGARMELRYDTEVRLTSVINPDGLTWQYEYDAAGRLISETDFNGRMLRYERDAAGRLVARTNGAGQTVRYRRDMDGNVTEQRTATDLTTFAYDPAGRLLRAANADATLEYTYDVLGRVMSEICNGQPVVSSYDMAGQRVGRRTPAGVDSAWAFDPAGRPDSLRTSGQMLVFDHDGAGREIRRRIGDAATLTQRWDADHRLTAQSIWNSAGQAQPGGPAQYRAYTYSQASNVLAIADHLTGDRQFEMDSIGRITTVRGQQWTERYRYDATGNLTGASVPTAGGDAAGSLVYSGTLIRHAGHFSYTHDGQGRISTRRSKSLSGRVRTWAFTWDAEDRLTEVVTPDGHHWRYRYDPIGRRIAKEHYAEDGTTLLEKTAFTWDGPVLIEQARQRPGEPLRTTTWDYEPGSFTPLTQAERSGLRDAPQADIDQRFYAIITDLIGTPSELISPSGDLAGHQLHTLWGTTTWVTGGASTPLRFPGQYADPETGLHYNNHRYYDPTTGAYLTPDPLGLTPAPNPHTYVRNPTVAVDPLGLAPCDAVPAGTGADDVVNGVRLAQQLTREEAASVFTPGGELKPDVVAQSREIINGTQLGNKQLISELTSNGSDLADWGKYTTPTFRSPAGVFQVHFYYNPVINKVFYAQDYKIVFVGGSP